MKTPGDIYEQLEAEMLLAIAADDEQTEDRLMEQMNVVWKTMSADERKAADQRALKALDVEPRQLLPASQLEGLTEADFLLEADEMEF